MKNLFELDNAFISFIIICILLANKLELKYTAILFLVHMKQTQRLQTGYVSAENVLKQPFLLIVQGQSPEFR